MVGIPHWQWQDFSRRDKVRFVSVWFGVFILGALFNPPSRASILMWFLAGENKGMISREADPGNHMYLTFEYGVGGKQYSGTGYAPGHAEMAKGQPVQVYFFPPVPNQSVIASKHEQLYYALFGLVLGALMGGFVGLIDHWNHRKTRGNSNRLKIRRSA